MKVSKKELKDRAFIPYEITITIESEEDHNKLHKDSIDVQGAIRNMSVRRQIMSGGAIYDLIDEIKNHKK